MPALSVLVLLVGWVEAYSEFQTTCTTPPSQTNYVSSPNTRGTLDILWSCSFTIIACTWTIQHLNVPEQPSFDPQDVSWHQALKWKLNDLWRSIKWMFVTIIAPEYILGKAVADLYAAYQSKKEMQRYAIMDGVEWGLTQALFANMGGFVLTQSCGKGNNAVKESSRRQMRDASDASLMGARDEAAPAASLRHHPNTSNTNLTRQDASTNETNIILSHLDASDQAEGPGSNEVLALGNNTFEVKPALPVANILYELGMSSLENQICNSFLNLLHRLINIQISFHLLARQIYVLRETGALPKLPKITASEINDKSKGDMFVKGITTLQVLWFILQVIVRTVRQLSISQLEVAVTAFGVCGIITYILVLPKPKGVNLPIVLMEFENHIPIEQKAFDWLRYHSVSSFVRGFLIHRVLFCNFRQINGCHIPNDAWDGGCRGYRRCLNSGIAVGSVIFGGIHVAAWNLSFPTPVEQILWRTASIMSTALLPIMYIAFLLGYRYGLKLKCWLYSNALNIIIGGLYVIARLFLLVEIFRTLFYLPEDAYITTWASNVPHVS